ncbi:MAG: multidrug ABC transporter ATP-binding protein [Saprospiraceae bacterium]|nr:MAG: multidrug ABC transporter ATP-binding protein [Saprospiraceae bacterium]
MQLNINQLTKVYPNGVKALDNLSLQISNGMFGLLGPNGAGKSSLMRTIATLQSPDDGSIHFNNMDILTNKMSLRKVLGYLPQEFGVYPRISAERLLDYLAKLKGIASKRERGILIDKCLEITNLTGVRKKYVSGYSGGMKQRFGIAQLLLNAPKLIIVDEPTAGLDPAERQRFLNILREIGTENIVIFSTHIVEDIKDLCTDMAIMNGGKILQHASPDEAILHLDGKVWATDIDRQELAEFESRYSVLSSSFNRDHTLSVRIYADHSPGDRFRKALPGLEDVYFTALLQSNH